MKKLIQKHSIKLVIVGILSIFGGGIYTGATYDENVSGLLAKLNATSTYVQASTTPSVTDKEKRIEELKASKEAERITTLWAEKTWLDEQTKVLEAAKEALREQELEQPGL